MKLHGFLLLNFLILVGVESTQSPPFACDSSNPSTQSFPFCKITLPIPDRARDLVSRLTLDEKIPQLVNSAPAIPRLGIPAYEWWSEALHGVADVGPGIAFNGTIRSATSFPQVILTAASFDVHLWYRIGKAIGVEARAVYNAGQAKGLTFWAPNINIFRDPRWGRGQETPGEDPLVTGSYSVSYVRGVQGDCFQGSKRCGELQASACCKHFTAYDLDDWKGIDRFKFDARVTMQDLADTYQPPFHRCIEEGRASGIMCAYNRVNGIPSCADFDLLTNTARKKWHFLGYITSDCDAVSLIHDSYGYAKTPEDAVVDVLKAGMDVNCGTYLLNHTKSAVMQKKLPVSQIDRALENLFAIRMRLGLFNGNPKGLHYGDIGPNQVCSAEHQTLALDAARDGIVLLKNSHRLLPFPKGRPLSLAVIGPNANSPKTLIGNYAGPPCNFITPLQALQGYANTMYDPGCDSVACSSLSIEKAVGIAKNADYVVLVMGLDQTQERESHDRVDLVLPGQQQQLITSVANAAKNPVVLVLLCGGPVDVSFAKYSDKIGSILWAGYPGGAGGAAIAQTIFGDHNPGGRLPVTWYPQDFTRIPMTDMRMRPETKSGYPGRTYRFYTGEKVFEFGYGLSYSTYSYETIPLSRNKLYFNQSSTARAYENSNSIRYASVAELGKELCDSKNITISIRVKNDGEMAGKHSVLLFVRRLNPSAGNPIKRLVGFQTVSLNAGQSADVGFLLNPCDHFSGPNKDGLMVVEEGTHFLVVGDQEYPVTIVPAAYVGVHGTDASSPPFGCDSSDPSTESYPFCNTTLPISDRVSDIVSRLTLDEKISQLINSAVSIPRLGIPAYEWWSEALHGIRDRHGIRFNGTIRSATSFPQVILTAASFDAHLWYRIGQAIGIETRAMYNAGQAMGMTFWAPNINIFRDPRWGRGQETPGEDPAVTGKYSVSYVRGLQGDTFEGGKVDVLQASACCKHFTAYDLDNWNGSDRYTFDARVTKQDMADTYQPPFQSCIEEGRASGLMCAYNRVNGVPSCADFNLLSETARGQWGFDGYIVSDCDAVSLVFDVQRYAKSPEDAVALVLNAGMDVDCGKYLQKHGKSAVSQKKLTESEIDRALHNLFTVRMRLGLFNGNPRKRPFGDIGPDQVCSKEHQKLALDAARSGIVLLKNSNRLLPLSRREALSLAVIGPNANATDTLLGNYAGPPCKFISPLQGLLSYAKDINIMYQSGCNDVACSSASIEDAVDVAKQADYVVLLMGLDQTQEREKHDRLDLGLPVKQEQLITSVAKAAKKPVVLVLLCGGPVDVSFAKDDSNIGSILWAGYPGEAGGAAIAETIFGDHNPGGRLPVTWYPKEFIKIPMTDMRMRPEPTSGYPGRTYRFYTGKKVFEFGDGLSYSSYSYEFFSVTQSKLCLNQPSTSHVFQNSGYVLVSELGTEFCEAKKFSAIIGVRNGGEMAGKHPVLLFVKQAKASNGSPIKWLVGFQSVHLDAGESANIEFVLSPCEHLSNANKDGSMVMEQGTYSLVIGDREYPITVVA